MSFSAYLVSWAREAHLACPKCDSGAQRWLVIHHEVMQLRPNYIIYTSTPLIPLACLVLCRHFFSLWGPANGIWIEFVCRASCTPRGYQPAAAVAVAVVVLFCLLSAYLLVYSTASGLFSTSEHVKAPISLTMSQSDRVSVSQRDALVLFCLFFARFFGCFVVLQCVSWTPCWMLSESPTYLAHCRINLGQHRWCERARPLERFYELVTCALLWVLNLWVMNN